MPNRIVLKKSSVTTKVPLAADLEYGELALNYTDGKLFFKNASNVIKSFTIDDSVVTLTGTQTLTNKTLTSPTLNSPVVSGGTINNTVIGGTTAAAITGTNVVATGTLNVTGATVLNGGLTMDTDKFTVADTTGNTAIGGTLAVTGETTLSAALAMSNNKITGLRAPTASTDAATKQYVDEVAQGIIAKPSVRAATTTNLSANYNNGTLGVGATLTADTNRVFTTLDGVTNWAVTSPPMGVLVKNQTNSAHNGRYNLTSLGSASTPWVLTKCGLCDEADEIPGAYVFVSEGTQAGTGWVQTVLDPDTYVVGTDAIIVTQFSGAGTFVAGTGLTLTGNTFSVNASQTQVTAVGTLATGTWNASVITGQYGGTGVNNSGKTITIGGNFTHTGAHTLGLTTTANTSVTLPTTGTLATLAGEETLTNKTLTSPVLTTPALGTPSSGNLANCTFPTLNQNTTGSAATLTTGRTIAITGDLTYTSGSFNGSANVTGTGTLATVNSNVGSFTNASVTVNAKGLVTAVSSGTAPVTSVTGTAPIVSSGGVTPAISISAATTSAAGSMSSADKTKLDGIATNATANTGTVTSVGGTGTVSGLTLTGTVTTTGNLTLGGTLSVAASNFASQTANTVLAAPNGSAGVPTFRTLVAADIPILNQNTTGSAATLTTARTINTVSFNGSANIVVEPFVEGDNSTDATRYITFVDSTTDGHQRLNEDSTLTYNPSSGKVSASGHVSTAGLFEHANILSENYAIASGNNAISAGPITIANGATITVPSGSTWYIT